MENVVIPLLILDIAENIPKAELRAGLENTGAPECLMERLGLPKLPETLRKSFDEQFNAIMKGKEPEYVDPRIELVHTIITGKQPTSHGLDPITQNILKYARKIELKADEKLINKIMEEAVAAKEPTVLITALAKYAGEEKFPHFKDLDNLNRGKIKNYDEKLKKVLEMIEPLYSDPLTGATNTIYTCDPIKMMLAYTIVFLSSNATRNADDGAIKLFTQYALIKAMSLFDEEIADDGAGKLAEELTDFDAVITYSIIDSSVETVTYSIPLIIGLGTLAAMF